MAVYGASSIRSSCQHRPTYLRHEGPLHGTSVLWQLRLRDQRGRVLSPWNALSRWNTVGRNVDSSWTGQTIRTIATILQVYALFVHRESIARSSSKRGGRKPACLHALLTLLKFDRNSFLSAIPIAFRASENAKHYRPAANYSACRACLKLDLAQTHSKHRALKRSLHCWHHRSII